MPRLKIKRKSTWVDMIPVCDVAFLLLTFFMLTSNFTQKEPVIVSTPASISEVKIPERNIMLILIEPSGKVFFGVDGQDNRIALLKKMGEVYSQTFTDTELKEFSLINSFGIPIDKMHEFLALKPLDRDRKENLFGIPCDSMNNQFRSWVSIARSVNNNYRIAIKADQTVQYTIIKKIMGTLQDLKENRYNLITSLEQNPNIVNLK
jgi:biopolymer transport protein ExbD